MEIILIKDINTEHKSIIVEVQDTLAQRCMINYNWHELHICTYIFSCDYFAVIMYTLFYGLLKFQKKL